MDGTLNLLEASSLHGYVSKVEESTKDDLGIIFFLSPKHLLISLDVDYEFQIPSSLTINTRDQRLVEAISLDNRSKITISKTDQPSRVATFVVAHKEQGEWKNNYSKVIFRTLFHF